MLSPHQAKYLAHELTKRCPSDSLEKLAGALSEAQVDLNPHQVEAALFAFRSPLSKGAILADEVGLGKTIEAGLLLSQQWAEGKRHLLVIAPSNLRKQWSQELSEKFFLPSIIMETRTFNEAIGQGRLNPFDQPAVILCSYQFARNKEPYLRQTPWDLGVIDEAHRLRNVYKNSSKIALSIKSSLSQRKKVLLTATPLQNTLLELYGLVSIIDDFAFGDLQSYREQFTRIDDQEDYSRLKERLSTLCKRTLRRQVTQYVPFTDRHALVQEFFPTAEEQRLYDLVSDYLQRPTLYALPTAQRQLMTLILRKLLASSTFAISHTLEGLAQKLDDAMIQAAPVQDAAAVVEDDLDDFDELADEWDEDSEAEAAAPKHLTPEQLEEIKTERDTLREFHTLARSIVKNSKGEALLAALRKGFAAAAKAQKQKGVPGFQQKALIFTESRRTQEYLFKILESTEFAGKTMVFNGSNADPRSKEIYQQWLERNAGTDKVSGSPTADKRASLVEYFRDHASIMIATEAAAEGINLQFCNLVVNYDLPWNPQRIEQRIGRCHRYGQKYDVVVVNFLNRANAADQRVYQLLDEKFKLFNGVFGASDEVIGAIESGVDFERRIAGILQRCRSPQQIELEFDALQVSLEDEIDAKRREAREMLLNNFDPEVVDKVKISSRDTLDRYQQRLWQVTRHALEPFARFDGDEFVFTLLSNPFPGEVIHPGPYRLGRRVDDANTYRVGHPLAQRLLDQCKQAVTAPAEVEFTLGTKKAAALELFAGKQGWLACRQVTLNAFEIQDITVLGARTDAGEELDSAACRRLLELPGKVLDPAVPEPAMLEWLQQRLAGEEQVLTEAIAQKNAGFFDTEMGKLDRWAEDKRHSLKAALDDLDVKVRDGKRDARLAPNLPAKLELQRILKTLEAQRHEAWKAYDEAAKQLDIQKEALLDEMSRRLEQQAERTDLFVLRWRLV